MYLLRAPHRHAAFGRNFPTIVLLGTGTVRGCYCSGLRGRLKFGWLCYDYFRAARTWAHTTSDEVSCLCADSSCSRVLLAETM